MTGFSPETFAYLNDLSVNNNRDWFEDNRNRYEAHWRAPALDFIAALADPMSRLSPKLKAETEAQWFPAPDQQGYSFPPKTKRPIRRTFT